MKRARRFIRAFEALQVLGFLVLIFSASESASIEENLITAATGAFMFLVGRVMVWYVKELGRTR